MSRAALRSQSARKLAGAQALRPWPCPPAEGGPVQLLLPWCWSLHALPLTLACLDWAPRVPCLHQPPGEAPGLLCSAVELHQVPAVSCRLLLPPHAHQLHAHLGLSPRCCAVWLPPGHFRC